jgi:hypothetical protein
MPLPLETSKKYSKPIKKVLLQLEIGFMVSAQQALTFEPVVEKLCVLTILSHHKDK